jgi:hypothetical protein
MAGFAGNGCDDFQFGTIRKGCFVGQATNKGGKSLWRLYSPKKQPTVQRAVNKSRQSLLMGQLGPQYPIEVSTRHSGYQIHNKHGFATTQQYEHGRRAGTC